MITKQQYIDANKSGLSGDMVSFYTPALQAAANLGYEGIDLSECESVVAYRFGKMPESGISYNYRDGEAEKGLSVAWLKGHKKDGKARFVIEFGDRRPVRVEGLLLPVTGSDGEPVILPFDLDCND